MSAIADIFAPVHLNLETGTFEVDAAKVADTAGASMSKKLSATLKSAIGAGIGVAAGAGLAGAITGPTGARRRDEAARGRRRPDRQGCGGRRPLDRRTVQGTTSRASMRSARRWRRSTTTWASWARPRTTRRSAFLTFQKATGQAAGAVSQFDDILDAWNLTAADTQASWTS